MPPRGRLTVSGDLTVPTGRTGACCWPPGERAGCCPAPTMPRTPPFGELSSPNVNSVHARDPVLKASNASTRLTFATVLQVNYYYYFLHLTDEKMKLEDAKRTVQGHRGLGARMPSQVCRMWRVLPPALLLAAFLWTSREAQCVAYVPRTCRVHLHPSLSISGQIMTPHSPMGLASVP